MICTAKGTRFVMAFFVREIFSSLGFCRYDGCVHYWYWITAVRCLVVKNHGTCSRVGVECGFDATACSLCDSSPRVCVAHA